MRSPYVPATTAEAPRSTGREAAGRRGGDRHRKRRESVGLHDPVAFTLRPAPTTAVDTSACALCGQRFHVVCNPRRSCATCGVVCCGSCAPPGTGGVRFCKACLHDPKQEYRRLSAVIAKYPKDADVWAAVAAEMHDDLSLIQHDGYTYTQADCYARAIELDPGRKNWASLARALPVGGHVDLDLGKKGTYRLAKLDCYANALYLRPDDARIWVNLASDLTPSQTIEISGCVYNKISAILHAIDIDDQCASGWALLGSALFAMKQKNDIFVNGRKFTVLECFEESLRLNPRRAATWNNVGTILPPTTYWDTGAGAHAVAVARCDETSMTFTRFHSGGDRQMQSMTAGTSFGSPAMTEETATPANLSTASPTASLRTRTHTATMVDDRAPRQKLRSYIVVGGRQFYKIDCAVEAVRLAPMDSAFKFNLATALCPGHPISLNGATATKEGLFREVVERATRLRSINLRAHLMMLFPDHERIRAIDEQYAYDESRCIGSGAYGSVFEASVVNCVTGQREHVLAAKVIDAFGVAEARRAMFTSFSNDEVRALIDVRLPANAVVQCRHIRVEPGRDRIVLFLERAEGSLADRVRGRVEFDPVRQTFHRLEGPAGANSAMPSRVGPDTVSRESYISYPSHGSTFEPSSAPQGQSPPGSLLGPTLSPKSGGPQPLQRRQEALRRSVTPFSQTPTPVAAGNGRPNYRLHESEIRHCAVRVLAALEEMHQLGATHQDIKPDNVLLFSDGGIKLGDLGSVAKVRGGKRKPGGTDPYLAPEALREINDPQYLQEQRAAEDANASLIGRRLVKRDVWSWGALVVHLASGRAPVKTVPVAYVRDTGSFAVDFSEGYQPMLPSETGVPHIPATVSRELRDLLKRCFCPNATDRPAVHELRTAPYFRRASLPADAEPLALYEHRRSQYLVRAQNGGADAAAADPEWSLVYRALPLFGAGAEDPLSPLRPLQQQSSLDAEANGSASFAAGGSAAPTVRPLKAEVLVRLKNVAEGNIDFSTA